MFSEEVESEFFPVPDIDVDTLRKKNCLQSVINKVFSTAVIKFPHVEKLGIVSKHDIQYRQSILHADRFQHGWSMEFIFTTREDPIEFILWLRGVGFYASGSQSHIAHIGPKCVYRLRVYILTEEFPTMFLWRRLHGKDSVVGPTTTKLTKADLGLK